MYWMRALERSQLVNGNVFAHGPARLNLSPADLTTFVDPPDAALLFGFRALDAGDPFEKSFPVWMATLRRRGGADAIIESLQRVFSQLADQGSLVELLQGAAKHARTLGYAKIWLTPAVMKEPLLIPSLKPVSDALGTPVEMVPTSGMCALRLA